MNRYTEINNADIDEILKPLRESGMDIKNEDEKEKPMLSIIAVLAERLQKVENKLDQWPHSTKQNNSGL